MKKLLISLLLSPLVAFAQAPTGQVGMGFFQCGPGVTTFSFSMEFTPTPVQNNGFVIAEFDTSTLVLSNIVKYSATTAVTLTAEFSSTPIGTFTEYTNGSINKWTQTVSNGVLTAGTRYIVTATGNVYCPSGVGSDIPVMIRITPN
jgi:hypothetical protein